ncbi:MAG: hypothetical protein ACM3MG_13880 [Bacillota bacterium]
MATKNKSKKIVFFLSLIGLLGSCTQGSKEDVKNLQNEISELKKTIEDLKPGLGDVMGAIQQHHVKLFFAGKNSNWDLSKFEFHEIQEGFEAATRWHDKIEGVETPVSELIKIKDASMQELESAIEKRSKDHFLIAFGHLTAACNECHVSANHQFIVIQEPKSLLFTNQKFEK